MRLNLTLAGGIVRRKLILALTLSVGSGCSEEPARSLHVSTDTLPSGRIVIDNLGPDRPVGSGWSLQLLTRIGSVGGPEWTTFGRIFDVALGPNGSVYILDAQANVVRVFDKDGEYLQTIGRVGRGPGELLSPYSLAFQGPDRLWVADEGNRRYTVFALNGESLATLRSPFHGGVGRGKVVIGPRRVWDLAFFVERITRPDGGMQQRSLGVGGLGLTLDSLVPVDTIPLSPWRPKGLVRDLDGERVTVVPPLGPSQVLELTPSNRMWVAAGDTYAVHAVERGGDTVLTIRRDVTPVPLSSSDGARVAGWLDRMVDQDFRRDPSVLPQSYPMIGGIVRATNGLLWVYRQQATQAVFDVFDKMGNYLGTVPSQLDVGTGGAQPYITEDRIVGVVTDSLGIPYVAVYEIAKPDVS